jgi:hypothetical protein
MKKSHCLKMKSLDFSSTDFPPFLSGLWIINSVLNTNGRSSKQFCLSCKVVQSCSYENDELEHLPSVYFSHSVISFALNMSVVRNYIFLITRLKLSWSVTMHIVTVWVFLFCQSSRLNIRMKVHQILEQAGITSFVPLATWLSYHIQ